MSTTTHRFRSQETLARAQAWLDRVGIPSDHIQVSSTGLPTLTISTEFARIPEVDLVLNAVELTDPEGSPSLDEFGALTTVAFARDPAPLPVETHTTPIGWHPSD